MIYDAIVIGLGSMGSSTLYQLTNKHENVLGIEQFYISHDRGSHFGQSRLIRKAYFEHPDYVPLLKRSYQLWEELDELTSSSIVEKTGLIYFGKPEGHVISGVLESAKKYHIAVDVFNREECKKQYPQFNLPDDYIGVLEPDAGFVRPELTISSYVQLAMDQGADVRTEERVLEWRSSNGEVTIVTDSNEYVGRKVVITAGPFVKELLPDMPTTTTRQHLVWFETDSSHKLDLGNFPCWGIEFENQLYYGFPTLPEVDGPLGGFKVGRHHPGPSVKPRSMVEDSSRKQETDVLHQFLRKWMPDINATPSYVSDCLYTMTEDENFLIDAGESNGSVVYGSGFSGHGFKFVPVIGEVLSDLIVKGETNLPIEFLSANRFH